MSMMVTMLGAYSSERIPLSTSSVEVTAIKIPNKPILVAFRMLMASSDSDLEPSDSPLSTGATLLLAHVHIARSAHSESHPGY